MQTKITDIKKLAIIAGKGQLPLTTINICKQANLPFFVLLIEGHCDTKLYQDIAHDTFYMGEVGRVLDILASKKISHVIFVGAVQKPNLLKLKLDAKGVVLLAKIMKAKVLGDNELLSIVIKFIETHGFGVISIKDLESDNLFSRKGSMGSVKPSKADLQDIQIGMNAVKIIGDADIGQAVIVENKIILSVEGIEGTDELLKRTKKLKLSKKPLGVLIKSIKPKQTKKIDLPTIGEATVTLAAKIGLKGIALSPGSVIILNKSKTIALADKLKIFIYGF